MMKIKQNDEVIVIAGKDKGSIGSVKKVIGVKVIVEGLNLAKKHVRANPQEGIQGGIEEKEMPLSISNVAIYNPTSKKADRIGVRTDDKGVKERFYKSSGESVL